MTFAKGLINKAVEEYKFSNEDIKNITKDSFDTKSAAFNLIEKNKDLHSVGLEDFYSMNDFGRHYMLDRLRVKFHKTEDCLDRIKWREIGKSFNIPVFSLIEAESLFQDPKTGELKKDAAEMVRKACTYDIRPVAEVGKKGEGIENKEEMGEE